MKILLGTFQTIRNFQKILSTMSPDYTTEFSHYSEYSENSDNFGLVGRLLNKFEFSEYSISCDIKCQTI